MDACDRAKTSRKARCGLFAGGGRVHFLGGAGARVACPPQKTSLSPYFQALRCCSRWVGRTAPLTVAGGSSPSVQIVETLVGPREGQRPWVSQWGEETVRWRCTPDQKVHPVDAWRSGTGYRPLEIVLSPHIIPHIAIIRGHTHHDPGARVAPALRSAIGDVSARRRCRCGRFGSGSRRPKAKALVPTQPYFDAGVLQSLVENGVFQIVRAAP